MAINARPHPSPLPQEREKHSTLAGEFRPSRFILLAQPWSRDAGTARETAELQERADCGSPSPGERVRVSASVILTSLQSQKGS